MDGFDRWRGAREQVEKGWAAICERVCSMSRRLLIPPPESLSATGKTDLVYNSCFHSFNKNLSLFHYFSFFLVATGSVNTQTQRDRRGSGVDCRRCQRKNRPPLMSSKAPLTNRAASLTRNSTAAATSSARPFRPSGVS